MAGPVSRLLRGRVRAAVARCGLATRGVAGPGPTGREPDPDSDWEPEERELQEVASALRRQERAVRLQKIRRQMEAPGAPPRTLTREAMEQIRYLHKEFAESWPVPRLAEGFDVSTDVIRRVLKSKFVPTLEQRLKQDQKALKKAGPARSLGQLRGSGGTSEPPSAGCPPSATLLMSGDEVPSRGHSHSIALDVTESNTRMADAPGRPKGRNRGTQAWGRGRCVAVPGSQSSRQEPCALAGQGAGDTRLPELPAGEKLGKSKMGEPGDQNFSSRVVQRGREFFDGNGNFLYRI